MIISDFKNILEFKREQKVKAIYNTQTTHNYNKKEVKNTKKDTIELSKDSNFDTNRAKKIEQLRESIKNGEYSVSSGSIAEAMVENFKTLK